MSDAPRFKIEPLEGEQPLTPEQHEEFCDAVERAFHASEKLDRLCKETRYLTQQMLHLVDAFQTYVENARIPDGKPWRDVSGVIVGYREPDGLPEINPPPNGQQGGTVKP